MQEGREGKLLRADFYESGSNQVPGGIIRIWGESGQQVTLKSQLYIIPPFY